MNQSDAIYESKTKSKLDIEIPTKAVWPAK